MLRLLHGYCTECAGKQLLTWTSDELIAKRLLIYSTGKLCMAQIDVCAILGHAPTPRYLFNAINDHLRSMIMYYSVARLCKTDEGDKTCKVTKRISMTAKWATLTQILGPKDQGCKRYMLICTVAALDQARIECQGAMAMEQHAKALEHNTGSA